MAKSKKDKNKGKEDKKAEKVLRAKDIIRPFETSSTDKPPKKDNEIPSFDLADEIMAEQRKLTSSTRKSPSKKIEPLRPAGTFINGPAENSESVNPQQEQIIRDIVRRDIESRCIGTNTEH